MADCQGRSVADGGIVPRVGRRWATQIRDSWNGRDNDDGEHENRGGDGGECSGTRDGEEPPGEGGVDGRECGVGQESADMTRPSLSFGVEACSVLSHRTANPPRPAPATGESGTMRRPEAPNAIPASWGS